ncbi:MAG: hypothetical protein DRQ60_01780 [Gammaproteobacteria bacterium]|nr:MAG: hypothetical protein DRQ54_00140 [Gammaproteobacteria bacterium]RLA15895.1 MAG: hypothetical protein DRQ52_00740 [Gammaproteobacteria bacterium]RLA17525.1 MAG: hypothetical protein DRQ60_01780 [Gammaproteobacteria bacterium]
MVKLLKRMLFLVSLLGSGLLFAEPVNVNTADAAQIAIALDGIGMTKAEEIVRYRETHGPFLSTDDLLKVKGIGEKTVEKNRENIEFQHDPGPQ